MAHSLYRWGKWSTDQVSNCLKIMQLISGRAGTEIWPASTAQPLTTTGHCCGVLHNTLIHFTLCQTPDTSMYIISFNLQHILWDRHSSYHSLLQKQKRRLREVNRLAQYLDRKPWTSPACATRLYCSYFLVLPTLKASPKASFPCVYSHLPDSPGALVPMGKGCPNSGLSHGLHHSGLQGQQRDLKW